MPLHIYNTMTRAKEVFTPIDPKNVRLYACGPTVYNHAHIGNAKPAVIFDLLARVLEEIYGAAHVTYSRNITDIDDKIIDAARELNVPIAEITEKYTRIYNDDMGAIGVRAPKNQPKATEYVPQMIVMIDSLITRGHAYAADGHVLFHVPSWEKYGRLSRRNRDDMIAGARVEVAPYKKDPADFILWKPSNPEQPGWDSPWGRGRPGWHIECSAMNAAINGEHFDIHAGGEDLIFPHHENEIAQSECAHGGKTYVNYWMHVGFVNMGGEKMSKSLGNVKLVHDLVRMFKPEALRYVLLSGHYRQPLDFTREVVEQATRTLDRYYGLLRDMKDTVVSPVRAPDAFMAALKDDLNTPMALAELSELANRRDKAGLLAAGAVMGLLQQEPDAWFHAGAGDDAADIDAAVAQLQTARAAKDYAAADAIRDRLKNDYGVVLSITKDGVTWRKET
jgi:cysteinyl-tRNA synthetase